MKKAYLPVVKRQMTPPESIFHYVGAWISRGRFRSASGGLPPPLGASRRDAGSGAAAGSGDRRRDWRPCDLGLIRRKGFRTQTTAPAQRKWRRGGRRRDGFAW